MDGFKVIRRTTIDGQFEGFDQEKLFPLADGTYWIQSEYRYWYHYAYCPRVEILERNRRYYIRLEGRTETVAVEQITDVTESTIRGEFTGWSGESVYELDNGQVWKQAEYDYEYTYAYKPEALIYPASGGYRMAVEGTSAVVRRIA